MASKVIRNRIQLVRGDTFRATLTLQDRAGGLYIPTPEDEIYFTVKRNAMTDKVLVKVKIENGELVLTPEDTEGLEYGSYVYDVQITIPNVGKDTVIKPNIFEILPEVNI